MQEYVKEQSVQERVVDVFKKIINIESLETKTIQELYFSAHDMVELVCRLEEIFNIKIDNNDAENFKTVQEVCDYVQNKITI